MRKSLTTWVFTETALANEAFGGEISRNGSLMDLGNRVSRKKDYIPVITKVIKGGWTKPKNLPRGPSMHINLSALGNLQVDPNDPYGNIVRAESLDKRDNIQTIG